jgi:hypothetical protein
MRRRWRDYGGDYLPGYVSSPDGARLIGPRPQYWGVQHRAAVLHMHSQILCAGATNVLLPDGSRGDAELYGARTGLARRPLDDPDFAWNVATLQTPAHWQTGRLTISDDDIVFVDTIEAPWVPPHCEAFVRVLLPDPVLAEMARSFESVVPLFRVALHRAERGARWTDP